MEGKTANQQIARATGTVMFAFIIGQVFSLLSQILIARQFGTGAENDAFNAANKLPDILYQLIAGGALASAFMPMFSTLLARGERAKELAAGIFDSQPGHAYPHRCRRVNRYFCPMGDAQCAGTGVY